MKLSISYRIILMLAFSGSYWLLGEFWRLIEMNIYGASQESAVDSVVGLILCAIFIAILEACDLIAREKYDREERERT